MNTVVKIKVLRKNGVIPKYATDGAAAVDLRAAVEEPLVIKPQERRLIPTGIAIALESREMVAVICARSGLSYKKGIMPTNGVGVIDSDYRGEIFVSITNNNTESYEIQPEERIAQLLFFPVYTASFLPCDTLEETERGSGGFGSTGRK